MNKEIRKYRIILADDHEILLDSLEKLLTDEPDLEIIGKVNSGQELLSRVEWSVPDLCIVDMDMPGMSGMVASEILIRKYPGIQILILTMHSDVSLIRKMVKMGISGYLIKTCDKDEFLFAIRQILKGKPYFTNELVGSSIRESDTTRDPNDLVKFSLLTQREMEIAKLLCEGLSNKQIGDKLFLSPKTVDNHRTSLMKKLDVHNVVELIRLCIRNGLTE